MLIQSHTDYAAAAERANALSDAPEGSAAAEELKGLVAALRQWDKDHVGDQRHGPEANPEPRTNRNPDDLPIAGLPGNLGKLKLD